MSELLNIASIFRSCTKFFDARVEPPCAMVYAPGKAAFDGDRGMFFLRTKTANEERLSVGQHWIS